LSKLRSGGQVDAVEQAKIEKAASEASEEAKEGREIKDNCIKQ
jgi:hypothetical protein